MKFVLEPVKVLKPTSDVVFKNLMKNEKNKDFLAKIISIVTKLDYDNEVSFFDSDFVLARVYCEISDFSHSSINPLGNNFNQKYDSTYVLYYKDVFGTNNNDLVLKK